MKIEKINEFQYLIDGEWYDLRSDAKYIYECLDKQKSETTEVKVETKEEIEIEECNEEEYGEYEEWRVPMPTEKSVIGDKKMDYELLGAITLISNRKSEYIEGLNITDTEVHRYIYEKGDNSILSNKEFLEEISGYKWDTIKRKLRKIASCGNDVVSYCEDEHGKYYKIMPYTLGDNGKLQYVVVDSRILDFLCRVFNSNTIKVYCVLLWKLWDNEKKCYTEKQITRDWLCKQIGLCENSEKNLSIIGDILFTFEELGLVTRRKETIAVEKRGCDTKVKTVYYYKIGDINKFLNRRNNYHK